MQRLTRSKPVCNTRRGRWRTKRPSARATPAATRTTSAGLIKHGRPGAATRTASAQPAVQRLFTLATCSTSSRRRLARMVAASVTAHGPALARALDRAPECSQPTTDSQHASPSHASKRRRHAQRWVRCTLAAATHIRANVAEPPRSARGATLIGLHHQRSSCDRSPISSASAVPLLHAGRDQPKGGDDCPQRWWCRPTRHQPAEPARFARSKSNDWQLKSRGRGGGDCTARGKA